MAKAGGAAALHTQGWYSLQAALDSTAQESTQQSPFLRGPAGKERHGRENPARSAGLQVGGKSPAWAQICHWGRFLPLD